MLGKLLAKSKLVVEWGLSTKDKLGLLFNKKSVKTIIHHNKQKGKRIPYDCFNGFRQLV